MAEIKTWSQTALSNSSVSPDGAPENMLPSGLNDTIRECMAAIRKWYDDAQWIDDGGAPTFVSATQFTLSGDKTAIFHVDRRIKCYGTTMGTLYGYITASTFASPNTTVTVSLDSGSLTSNLSRVYYGGLSKTNHAIPKNVVAALAGLSTQTFDVANATAGTHAVNRSYGDTRYAQLAGVNTQVFNVAAATAGDHAVNRTTADGRYGQLATTNTWALQQTFSTQPKAPAYGFTIGGSTAYIDADASNIAVKPPLSGKLYVIDTGGTRRPIECGNASNSVEAVTLGQADARYAPITVPRNRIINGNFAVNQRGVSGTVTLAAGAYGHDGWKAGASGCTYTFSTAANVTTLSISAGSLQQIIKGNNLETGTYVLSWTGTAQGKIGAGAFSASGVSGSVTGGSDLTVEFNTGTLSKVQLETGSTATPFAFEDKPIEVYRCQRRYERLVVDYIGYQVGGQLFGTTAKLVEKDAAPTISQYSAFTGTNCTFSSAGAVDERGFTVRATVTATGTFQATFYIEAKAEP